ncbi:MAG TPA: DUF732 domain-containing protein [Mycobacterium sp.]|nr:DUF732 domain-containing protein [Mycobacterium sp.]
MSDEASPLREQARQDNGTNLYEDEAMRMLVVLASFAAVIGVATPAQADPNGNNSGADASFLSALDNAGITYDSGADAIAAGKRACALMDQGHPASDVIKSVSASNPGFTTDSATKFTAIATNTYCPQHLGEPTAQPPPPPPSPAVWPEFPWPALPAA